MVDFGDQRATRNSKRKLLDFPTWVGTEERRFLQGTATSFQPDVVVAADGTGDYATVAEAVEALGYPLRSLVDIRAIISDTFRKIEIGRDLMREGKRNQREEIERKERRGKYLIV